MEVRQKARKPHKASGREAKNRRRRGALERLESQLSGEKRHQELGGDPNPRLVERLGSEIHKVRVALGMQE